jgi:hypothetical protein
MLEEKLRTTAAIKAGSDKDDQLPKPTDGAAGIITVDPAIEKQNNENSIEARILKTYTIENNMVPKKGAAVSDENAGAGAKAGRLGVRNDLMAAHLAVADMPHVVQFATFGRAPVVQGPAARGARVHARPLTALAVLHRPHVLMNPTSHVGRVAAPLAVLPTV